jgi:hypothetical protein
MATVAYSDVSATRRLAHERRLQQYAMHARGWQQHVAPLAQHMTEKRLVRTRDAGACLLHLDLDVLRETLSRLLCHE